MKLFINFILIVTGILSAAFTAYAQTCPPLTAGCLDETFGAGGKTVIQPPLANNPLHQKLVRQSDSKIVALANASDSGNTFRNVIILQSISTTAWIILLEATGETA